MTEEIRRYRCRVTVAAGQPEIGARSGLKPAVVTPGCTPGLTRREKRSTVFMSWHNPRPGLSSLYTERREALSERFFCARSLWRVVWERFGAPVALCPVSSILYGLPPLIELRGGSSSPDLERHHV